MLAFSILALILSGVATLSSHIIADDARMNCVKLNDSTSMKYFVFDHLNSEMAQWIVAVGFFFQLGTVSFNYGQIIRHVRRKFWQRKARGMIFFFY